MSPTLTPQLAIGRVTDTLALLPLEKILEVAQFATFLRRQYEEELLQQGIQHLTLQGNAFSFLETEEDIYEVSDIKEPYQ